MIDKRTFWRGDIYRVDFGDGFGSEQGGIRPAVVVQNNMGNWFSPTVIVVPLTSRVFSKSDLPTHSFVMTESGVDQTSLALAEQVRVVDKKRLYERIGHLNQGHMNELDNALSVSVGLSHERPNELRLCLCPDCARKFYESNRHFIRRENRYQRVKECCDICRTRRGFDYIIFRKASCSKKES